MGKDSFIRKMIVSAFGLGYLPIAPGTWASAAAAAVYVLLRWATSPLLTEIVIVAGVLFCLWLGVGLGAWAEEHYARKDARQFVLDEVAGQWLTCSLLPIDDYVVFAAGAFIAFRVFDVLKPFPIRRLEKLPAGWGIMLDDLLAAVYAAIVLNLLAGLHAAIPFYRDLL